MANSGTQPSNVDIQTLYFWPIRVGLYSSCNEAAVRDFFAHKPANFDRKAMRKQAMRWHPNRAMRLFGHARDKDTVHKTVTIVAQVINGIMATYTA